jgi:hypothetical protein
MQCFLATSDGSVDGYLLRGTLAQRGLVSFLRNPLADVGWAIVELGAIGFAARKKHYGLAVNEPNFL